MTDNKALITGKTKLLGVIGHPVEHSLSPVMHNAAIASLGLDYAYLPFPFHALANFHTRIHFHFRFHGRAGRGGATKSGWSGGCCWVLKRGR